MTDKKFLTEFEIALNAEEMDNFPNPHEYDKNRRIIDKGKKKLLEGMRVPNSHKSILKYMKQLGEENDMEISRRGEINGSDFV